MSAHSIDRRHFLIDATAVAGAACAAAGGYPFLASMAPSAAAKAAGAPVEAEIGNLVAGELKTVAWRGRPVWIMRRTAAMLAAMGQHDSLLADPGSARSVQPVYCRNQDRSARPDVFVCVGVCTHLGCTPKLRVDPAAKTELGADWPGGFFCPCHGSKFDLAGRVFKGVPAPVNLEIPPYRYLSDNRLRIGEDNSA
jgi:ubiquinol-cytochrome c reductase iron-sulfur subunit